MCVRARVCCLSEAASVSSVLEWQRDLYEREYVVCVCALVIRPRVCAFKIEQRTSRASVRMWQLLAHVNPNFGPGSAVPCSVRVSISHWRCAPPPQTPPPPPDPRSIIARLISLIYFFEPGRRCAELIDTTRAWETCLEATIARCTRPAGCLRQQSACYAIPFLSDELLSRLFTFLFSASLPPPVSPMRLVTRSLVAERMKIMLPTWCHTRNLLPRLVEMKTNIMSIIINLRENSWFVKCKIAKYRLASYLHPYMYCRTSNWRIFKTIAKN